MIRVLFFASLREALGREAAEVSTAGPLSISDLVARLVDELGEEARAALTAESVRVAVNQEITSGNVEVYPDDEVAFLPPVTGG